MQLICVLLIIPLAFENSFAEFPPDITRCKVRDVVCIAKVTTQIVQNNPNGRNDIGLPRIEPFHLNSLAVSQGETGGLSLSLNFKDIDIGGLSKVTVDKVTGFDEDPETSKFELSLTFPTLTFKGQYTANGRILILPIQGNGEVDITLEKVQVSAKYKPSVTNQNGKQHLGINKLKLLIEPSKMKIRLENLFNGDKGLGDNMNTFLNDNWRDIWIEVGPAINEAISGIVKTIMTSVFKKITYDEFYQKD